jgi:hypothetical protein
MLLLQHVPQQLESLLFPLGLLDRVANSLVL